MGGGGDGGGGGGEGGGGEGGGVHERDDDDGMDPGRIASHEGLLEDVWYGVMNVHAVWQ